MSLKYLNQIKYYLKIIPFIFFIILFFQINTAKAECTWWYISPGPFPKNNCSYLQGTTLTPGGCDNITRPTGGTAADYICCCKPDTPAAPSTIDDGLPNFKIPDLQVKIPGLTFTPKEQIQANCTEVNGKKTCNFPWIGEYIAGVYKYAIGIVGILAAVVLMVGGVLWIVAGGNATTIGEAKAWIGASLTGLIIALTSYVILYQVNPALLTFGGLNITLVEKIKQLVETRTSGTAEQFKSLPCPDSNSLATGVDFYATGYMKPPNDNSKYSLCMIAMNCSCPSGQDGSQNCDEFFPNYKNYHPCYAFSGNNYCNKNSSGKQPQSGDVAVDYSCFNKEQQICVNRNGAKTTYTARDSGGGIKGRRLDIWSGDSIDAANKNSGVVNITLGACQ